MKEQYSAWQSRKDLLLETLTGYLNQNSWWIWWGVSGT